jgi:shikimate dehydrogenase
MASRREPGWPPAAAEYDVLVNATPVKDELIVEPHAGMQVVDLAYLPDGRETALVAAARAAGCRTVIDGLDVLLLQGAAALELWTKMRAPLAAMRDALRHA